MMYRIFSGGVEVNTIVSDETFVSVFCETHGYTYERLPDRTPDGPDDGGVAEPSVWDELDAAYAAGYREGVDSV